MQFDLDLNEAQQKLIEIASPLEGERVLLLNAVGRVLAQEIIAKHDVPLYRQSAVDGFAVGEEARWGDQFLFRERLITPETKLEKGEAWVVVTGGLVPEGTRKVIPHEDVLIEKGYVSFSKDTKEGSNLKSVAEDLSVGQLLAQSGTRISPGHVSLMAAFGYDEVLVYRRPRVGILSLGKGIVSWQENPRPDQVRDSNGPLLSALASLDGGQVVSVDLAADSSRLREQVVEILDKIDLLIVSGGTHAQDYDEARAMLEEIGAELHFWGVKIRPGGHPGAAVWGSRIIICLSGNPAACLVGYQMLVSPVVRLLQGVDPFLPRVRALCTNSFDKKSGPRRLVRAQATVHEDGWRVAVLPGQKSSMMSSFIDCNALIDIPPGQSVQAGSEVAVILLSSDFSSDYTIRKSNK